MSFLSSIFTGGIVKSVENVAKEWIETSKEKAQASTLMLKTLDPNGLMRRQISQSVTNMYIIYIFIMLSLLLMQSFQIGNPEGVNQAITKIVELFVPITTSFTAIVGASFGVNGINASKEKNKWKN